MAPPDPRRAALLSALLPGLGQWSLGQRGRGLALGIAWAFLALTMFVAFTLPFIVALWAYGIVDAHQVAIRLQAKASPPMEGPFQTCPTCGAACRVDFRRCPDCDGRLPGLL